MAGEVFTGDKGTMKSGFQVGGPLGPGIEKDGSNLAVKDPSGNVVNVSLKDAVADSHAATLRDVKRTANVMIEFSFDGASAPTPGAHTGQFGMCGKTGGSYNAGEIVYDDGVAIIKTSVYKGQTITTACAVTGTGYTVTLIDNGFYAAEAAVAPFNWTMKGDGTSDETGMIRRMKIDFALATVFSSASIPMGSILEKAECVIENPYSVGTTIKVEVDGVTVTEVLGVDDIYPQEANSYVSEADIAIKTANQAGKVKITIEGSPTEGSGFLVMSYCGSFLA